MAKNMKTKLMVLAIVPIFALGSMNCGKLGKMAKKAAKKAGYGGTKAANKFVKQAPIFIYALTKSTQDATKFMKKYKKKKIGKKAKKQAAKINRGLKKLGKLLAKKKQIVIEAKNLLKTGLAEAKNYKKNGILMKDLLKYNKDLGFMVKDYKKILANLKNGKSVIGQWKKFVKKKKLKLK